MQTVREYLIRGVSGVFAVKVGGIFLALLSSIVLARAMGPEDFGLYSFVLETMLFISIPVAMGFSQLLTREVAKYNYQKQFSPLKGIIIWSSKFTVFVSFILILVTAIFIFILTENHQKAILFLTGLPIIFIVGLREVMMGSLRGLKRAVLSQLPEAILRHILVILSVIVLYWGLDRKIDSLEGLIVTVISIGLSFVFGLVFLLKAIPIEAKITKSEFESKEWLHEALPFFMLGAIAIVNAKISLIIVGFFRPPAEVGFYKIAVTASTIVSFLLMAVNVTISPLISEFYHGNQKERLQKILTKSVRLIFVAGLFISIVYWIFGKFLINVFYGEEFLPAYAPLVILTFGQLVNVGAGSVGQVLSMTGYQRDTLVGHMVAAVANIILSFILIPRFGVNGGAVATALSLLTWNIILLFFLKKRTSLKTSII